MLAEDPSISEAMMKKIKAIAAGIIFTGAIVTLVTLAVLSDNKNRTVIRHLLEHVIPFMVGGFRRDCMVAASPVVPATYSLSLINAFS
jgi:hypothetical protein